jgi:anaerobic ribonucleoside-triphosphate reductase activating protein
MLIKRIAFPVTALGPNNRIALWTCGCNKRCVGCIAQELQKFDNKYEIPLKSIKEQILEIRIDKQITSITISGGEPFLQDELPNLLLWLRTIGFDDILVYSGMMYEDLKTKYFDSLSNIDVLIDGEYIDIKNDNMALAGSSNQRIIFLNPALIQQYQTYLNDGRKQQVIPLTDSSYDIYGLPPAGFREK